MPGRGRGRLYGAGSISADGTLFAGNGPLGDCGVDFEIRRFDVDGTLTTIYEFPRNRQNTWKTFAVDTADGGTDLLFDQLNCRTGNSNVYLLENADSVTRPAEAIRLT